MTRDAWLVQHPYLQPMADLHAVVNSSAGEIVVPTTVITEWEEYLQDFIAGVPLLQSTNGGLDLRPAELLLLTLVQKLSSRHLPGELDWQIRALGDELRHEKDSPNHAVAWLLDKNSFSTAHPGLLQYLGWTVLRRYLSRVVAVFANWRDEERWLRNYCPTCGSPPAMAQFVGVDPERFRLLCCGCCATRWRYRRNQCPFCEKDEHRLAAFAVEGSPLRIDYCEACGGYLKTCRGESSETPLLADWTSIHLDVVARDKGLKRFAGSLYQF
jgi:FdhE protein